ncbi:MAG TPA: MarR family transcriptional regulator [Gemmatimonadaceae bacterium]
MPSRLQDEIKQSRPFERPGDEALLSILRTASVLEYSLNELLRPFGLTMTQYNVLRILQGAGSAGLCGREIGERLVSRVPDVSRLLDRMTELALVSKKRDAADQRHVTSRITAKGRRLLAKATPALEEAEGGRMDRLSDRSVKALIEALELIREAS